MKQKKDFNAAELIRETISVIREKYSKSGHADLENHDSTDFDPNAETASQVLAYQVLIAQLNAINNSRDADAAWHNIDEHLQPLLGSLFNKKSASTEEDEANLAVIDELRQKISDQESYIEELESAAANQREAEADLQTIDQLERTIEEQKTQILSLEQAAQKKGNVTFESEAEKFCTEVIKLVEAGSLDEIGKLTTNFQKEFTAGVTETTVVKPAEESKSAGTDLLHQGLKNSQSEIDELRNKISSQHETIRDLELKLANNSGDGVLDPETEQSMAIIKQNLKDSEMCIETMDMELNSAHEHIERLESELKQLTEQSEMSDKRVDMIQDFANDTKQLLDCITVLEDSAEEQREEIEELTQKLAQAEAEKNALVTQATQASEASAASESPGPESGNEQAVEALNQELEKLKAENEALMQQAAQSDQQEDIERLTQELAQVNNEKTELEKQQEAGKDQTQQIEALQTRLAEVEAEKEELEKLSTAFQTAFDLDESPEV